MMHRLLIILAVAFLLGANAAFAEPATPFGLVPGKTTLAEVQTGIAERTTLRQAGVSAVVGGPILKGDGAGLEFPDLQGISLIFDETNVLQYVQLTLPKGGLGNPMFVRMDGQLSKKYRRTRHVAPFVGNQSAVYQSDNVEIQLDAPHLSFELTVAYLTPVFKKAFATYERTQRQARARQERDNL